MKAKCTKRNTFAARLRNCRTVAERFRLLLTGRKENVVSIVTRAQMQRTAEIEARTYSIYRGLARKWREELEIEIGKLVLSMVMAGDVTALRALVSDIEGELADTLIPDKMTSGFILCAPRPLSPHEDERLRRAIMAIGPGCYAWGELQKRLRSYRAGGHDRRHIRRTWKELEVDIRIAPGKSGPTIKPRTRKG